MCAFKSHPAKTQERCYGSIELMTTRKLAMMMMMMTTAVIIEQRLVQTI
jgi:hypothetical protein